MLKYGKNWYWIARLVFVFCFRLAHRIWYATQEVSFKKVLGMFKKVTLARRFVIKAELFTQDMRETRPPETLSPNPETHFFGVEVLFFIFSRPVDLHGLGSLGEMHATA